jgi:hypothetical protein
MPKGEEMKFDWDFLVRGGYVVLIFVTFAAVNTLMQVTLTLDEWFKMKRREYFIMYRPVEDDETKEVANDKK